MGRNMRLEEMLEECALRSGVLPGGGEGGVLRPLLPPRHLEDQPGGGAVQGALHGEEREDPQEEEQAAGRPGGLGQFHNRDVS